MRDPLSATAWWTSAKLVVWIAPVFVFSRLVHLPRGGLRLNHLRGFGIGLLLSIGWIAANASAESVPAPAINAAVLSSCFLAPFMEELLFRGFAFSYIVRSEERVDAVLAEAEQAGGSIVKPAQREQWGGYSGYFADPDGYLWKVAAGQGEQPYAE